MSLSDCFLNAEESAEATLLYVAPEPSNVQAWLDGLGLDGRLRATLGDAAFAERRNGVAIARGEDGRRRAFYVPASSGVASALTLAGVAESAPDGVYQLAEEPPAAQADILALGWALGAYRFDAHREIARPTPRLVLPASADGARVRRMADGVALIRDLVNTPPNHMGPAELETAARAVAERYDAEMRVIIGDDLLEENYPLIHAVGRASTRAPRLIDFTWGDPSARKVTLVGKGVCFDTGGLNLKPESGMLLMKKDMGGAAHVLGLARMIMDAQLPCRLRVLIPAVENAVSGSAMRPGDVYPSRKGLSVEIANTDAEGRLILADAIAEACDEQPDHLIVMATLTGAARQAIGPQIAPFYTPQDEFAEALTAQSAGAADPVWRMPLWDGYDSWLDSQVADVNHISSTPMAGSITAALFLQRFVSNAAHWAHFDIFAWNPKARPGFPVGAETHGVRTLYGYFENLLMLRR